MQILDPTHELTAVKFPLAPRPVTLSGKIALLDINKPRGDKLLDRLQVLFTENYPEVELKRYKKLSCSKLCQPELRDQIVNECDLVVEGLAD
jgi:hypothetical protein